MQLLIGPQQTGKTNSLARRYADRLAQAGSSGNLPRQLWLAPHRLAADGVRRRLINHGSAAQSGSAALSPGVKTMHRWCESLVASRLSTPQILPRSASRWLLGEAIAASQAAGDLDLLDAAAGHNGLVDAAEQMVRQLKLRGVAANKFATFARSKNGSRRDVELASIYSVYEASLTKRNAADQSDVPRIAAESYRHASMSYDLVVVDGFDSFSRYQRALLAQLIERADKFCVAMDVARTDREIDDSELDAAANRTIAWLRQLSPDAETTTINQDSESPQIASLVHLRSNLFYEAEQSVPQSTAVVASANRLQVIAASDPHDEAIQLARRIKALVVDQKVAPRDIVVAVPAVPLHERRLREVFDRFGVPVALGLADRIGEAAELRALMSVLAVAEADWPYRDLLGVLRNRQFTGLDEFDNQASHWPSARGAAEWLVRELQIYRGRKSLLSDVERIAAAPPELGDPRQSTANAARPLLELLANACDQLPNSATPTEWVAACEQIALTLGLDLSRETSDAWSQVCDAVVWIERTAEDECPKWKPRDWTGQLRDWTGTLNLAGASRDEGCVRILAARDARFAHMPHLFLFGLAEQSLSANQSGGMYTDQQYDRLAALGSDGKFAVPTVEPHQRAAQLFYDVVCQATESLSFSFAALDAAGQPTPPSPLLDEACQAFGEPLVTQINMPPQLTALPPNDSPPRSHADWRLLAVNDGKAGDAKLLGGLLANSTTRLTALAVTNSLAMSHHRVRGDSFGPFEGLMIGDRVRQMIAGDFDATHLWSTSQLETYAYCPHKFLLKQIMRLEPVGDIALETDYRRRGTLLHRAMVQLHQQLDGIQPESPLQPSAHDEATFHESFEQAVVGSLDGFASYGIDGALNELLAGQIRKWADDYYEQHATYDRQSQDWDQPLRPTYYEIRFGNLKQRPDDDPEDAASTNDPLVIDLGDEKILVAGRIDRVDLGRVGEQVVLQVVDYKTASDFRVDAAEIADGRKLQPALYAMAAAQIVSTTGSPALPVQAGYWVIRKKGFVDNTSLQIHSVNDGLLAPTEEWTKLEPLVIERVRQIVDGVRHGDFPMVSPDENCTSHCDFSHVCRVGQVRSLGKVWPPVEADEQTEN